MTPEELASIPPWEHELRLQIEALQRERDTLLDSYNKVTEREAQLDAYERQHRARMEELDALRNELEQRLADEPQIRMVTQPLMRGRGAGPLTLTSGGIQYQVELTIRQ